MFYGECLRERIFHFFRALQRERVQQRFILFVSAPLSQRLRQRLVYTIWLLH
jgi:hypothetical protein